MIMMNMHSLTSLGLLIKTRTTQEQSIFRIISWSISTHFLNNLKIIFMIMNFIVKLKVKSSSIRCLSHAQIPAFEFYT